jgi:hypothetical protein
MFITLTVAPGATVAGTVYLNELMWIIAAVFGIADCVEVAGDEDAGGLGVLLVAGEPAADESPEDPQPASIPSARRPTPTPTAIRASGRGPPAPDRRTMPL